MTGSGGWLKQFPGGFITSYRTSAWSMSTDLEAPCVPKTPQHVPIFFFHIISENSPEAWETANSAIQNLKPQKMVGIYSLKIASFHRTWSKIQPKFRQIRPKPQGFRHPKGIPRGFQGDSRPRPFLLSYAAWASPWPWPSWPWFRCSARFRRQKGQVLEASNQVLDGIDLDEIIIYLLYM